MLTTRIFGGGPLFTLVSERRWAEIKGGVSTESERLYRLDLEHVRDDQDLFGELLAAFGLDHSTNPSSLDACLDHIRGALVVRPEKAVLLAIFRADGLLHRNLHAHVTLVSLLTNLSDDVLNVSPSGLRHRVRLRVVFFGLGANYPDEPSWLADPSDHVVA